VRKLGGFTFQELNLTLEDIQDMSHGGADLSYDFVTRPAYHHALVTGDGRVPAPHARTPEVVPDRSGRTSSMRCRTMTSSPSSSCTSGPGTRTRQSPSAARR
jgi:hypothetical protein